MAYEVTATRRRPQRFEDLVGQEFVAETLKNSIASGKIAHAYLFSGPRGCGKTSSARILAKALNCQSSETPSPEPCGVCESCKAITASSSFDVIEIDGASNTSVNDVRQIKDEVMFPPNSARYKIYIIDEVHMLSTSAFNALLKTIEEPPPYVIFIFATTELQKVPATIKSRCQQFNFRLVPVEKIKNLLSDACRELNIQADDEALYWIAKESGGSIRDSYTLFDQIVAFSDGHITYDKIRDKLGLLGVDRLNEIFDKCVASDTEGALSKLDEFLQSGISIEQFILNCTEYLRSVLLIKNGVKKESLLGQSPDRYSKNVLESWNVIQTERAISIFLQLYKDVRYSVSPRYEIELALSRLCWLKDYVSPSEVKMAIDKAASLLQGSSKNIAESLAENRSNFSVESRAANLSDESGAVESNYSDESRAISSLAQSPSVESDGRSNTFTESQGGSQMQVESRARSNSSVESGTISSLAQSPNIPEGMPHFSIFDNVNNNDSDGEDSEDFSDDADDGSQMQMETRAGSNFSAVESIGDSNSAVESEVISSSAQSPNIQYGSFSSPKTVALPLQVQIIRDTFKGKVVGM